MTPTWSISSGTSYASISSSGVLTAKTVSSAQTVTVKASYTEGGATKTNTKTVTVNPVAVTTYTITYKPGSYGTGSQQTATKTKGQALTLKGAIFTRSGYTQKGWSTSTYGTSKAYALSGSYTTDAAATFYPYWEKNADSVTLSKSSDLGHDYKTFTGSFTVTASSSWTLTQSVTESWLHVTKSGNKVTYTFDQNNTSVYRGCKFTVTCGSASASCQVNQAGRTVDVLFDANGGTISGESTKKQTAVSIGTTFSKICYWPLRTGYTYDGWSTSKTGSKISDDATLKSLVTDSQTLLTVYARWKSNTRYVVITWDANGGQLSDGISTESGSYDASKVFGTLPSPTRTGYTFAGWFTQKSGGTQIYSTTTVSSAVGSSATSATIYAHWTATVTLSSISISGAASVASGGTATFACRASYSNGTTKSVTPTWAIYPSSSYASISSSGVLTASKVSSEQTVTVKAIYTEGSVTKTATQLVTIKASEFKGKPNLTFYRYGDAASWPQAVFLGKSGTTAVKADSFNVDETIFLYNCFMNNGDTDVSCKFKILHDILDESGALIAENYTDEVSPFEKDGSRWFYGMEISALQNLAAGKYTYRCTLDSDGVVDESSESDNVVEIEFEVVSRETDLVCGQGATSFGTRAMPFVVTGTYGDDGATSFSFVADASGAYQIWLYSTTAQNSYLQANLSGNSLGADFSLVDTQTFSFVKGQSYIVKLSRGVYNSSRPSGDMPFKMQFGGAEPAIPFIATPNVSATLVGSDVRVTWNAVPGARKYHVYRDYDSPKTGFPYFGTEIEVVESGTCSIIDANPWSVVSEDKCWYYVYAEGDDVSSRMSDRSNVISYTPTPSSDMTLKISQGWTWISVNTTPTDGSFAAAFKGVAFADEDVIKSSDGSATYYGGTWYPSPSTFKFVPGRAYAVKKSTTGTATVTVTGTAAPTTLAVEKGWNWVGPTSSAAVSLKDLKHSAGFEDDDVINSSGGSATYYGGTWYGSLQSLVPGVGYKAKFGKAGTLEL